MSATKPASLGFIEAQQLDSRSLRQAIRACQYTGHTAGLAPGMLQANVVILPEDEALDFMRFCQRNPQACPLVGVSDTGRVGIDTLAQNLDLRSDVPGYNVYRHGELVAQHKDISALWREDLVTFALGCSFTFEQALMRAGVDLYHVKHNTTVPMFRTELACREAGKYGGNMVVSMRGIDAEALDTVRNICEKYPHAHGAPVHWGSPEAIGIHDLNNPDWGDAIVLEPGQIPVFWACGVTSQNALDRARPSLCISHTPGHMLVTDVPEDRLPPFLEQS